MALGTTLLALALLDEGVLELRGLRVSAESDELSRSE